MHFLYGIAQHVPTMTVSTEEGDGRAIGPPMCDGHSCDMQDENAMRLMAEYGGERKIMHWPFDDSKTLPRIRIG